MDKSIWLKPGKASPFNSECANQNIIVLYKEYRDVKNQVSKSSINTMKKSEDILTFLKFREYYGNLAKFKFRKIVGKNADNDLKNKSDEL